VPDTAEVRRDREPGQLEQEILLCLAAHDGPMTPAEVLEDLGGDLAYTTIMTTLRRMHAKQALVRTPRGRAYAYALPAGVATAQASMAAHQMRRLLDREGDRAQVLAQFVAQLSPEDERLLQELLQQTGEAP
jgi:predicted transcriptional regulator